MQPRYLSLVHRSAHTKVISKMSKDSAGNAQTPIINACLSYVKFCMISKDHSYVQDATCAKFHYDTIKESYGILFKYVNPSKNFGYRGPNDATIREKSVHAFNEIYKLLHKLDNEAISPIIACPSDELRIVLPPNSLTDYTALDNRLRQLELDMTRVNYIESTVTEHSKILSSNANQATCNPSSNPPAIMRLQSRANRDRSSSVCSVKRKGRSGSDSSDSTDDESSAPKGHKVQPKDKRQKLHDVSQSTGAATGSSTAQLYPSLPTQLSDLPDGFEYDKYQKRKMRKNDNRKLSVSAKPSTPAYQGERRRFQFVQGKDESASENFCGVRRLPRVPQAFISRCDPERSTEDGVKNHLIARGVSVTEVKLASHPSSTYKSFKVTVNKLDDFNLLLPKSCRVKKFIPPRSEYNNNPGFFRGWESTWDSSSRDIDAIRFKQNLDDLSRLEEQVTDTNSDRTSSLMETTPISSTVVATSESQQQIPVNNNVQARNSTGVE